VKGFKRLVRLYPKAWRERYEAEFLAMLEQLPVTLHDILNILLGIADAHLHGDLTIGNLSAMERMRYMLKKFQRTCSGGLAAFLFFLLPCALFNAMLDDSPIPPVMRSTQAFGLSYDVFVIGCLLAGLAVLIGGLAILYGVFQWAASQKRRDILLLLFAPAALLILFVAAVFILNWTFENAVSGWLRGSINQCMGALFLFLSGACVYSALQKAKAASLKIRLFGRQIEPYRLGAFFAIPAACCMAIATVAAVVWGFLANAYMPDIMQNGNLGLFQSGTMFMYGCIVLVMLASTAFSSVMAAKSTKYLKG